MNIFDPYKIESVGKLSPILVIPLLAAAVYVDFGLWVVDYGDKTLRSWQESGGYVVAGLVRLAGFVLSVVVVSFAYVLAQICLSQYRKIEFFAGVSMLAFGVLGLGAFLPHYTHVGVNIYWHLGALAWGLVIFTPFEKDK